MLIRCFQSLKLSHGLLPSKKNGLDVFCSGARVGANTPHSFLVAPQRPFISSASHSPGFLTVGPHSDLRVSCAYQPEGKTYRNAPPFDVPMLVGNGRIGSFGIASKAVGFGGSSVVVKLEHLSLACGYAAKLVLTEGVFERTRAYAERELKAHMRFQEKGHPSHVLPLLGVFEIPQDTAASSSVLSKTVCMVFPYVQKGSLEPRDPFSYEDDDRPTFKSASSFMLYALSVAQAVQQCHQVGVAHMDLKLSNIMPKDDGSGVWLIDFGVARVLEEGQDTCVFHARTGSPFYIAPEFDGFKGAEAALLNPKACDVYSLGKVFVALLGGDIRAKELVWPEGFEGLYPACVKLIEKMLSSNPLERPSIEDVVGVLETLRAVS